MPKKQFITTICIDNDAPPCDDLSFIEKRGLKPTNLLRAKIKELRLREEGEPDAEALLKKVGRLNEIIQKYADFIEAKGLIDDFFKE